MEDDPPIEVLKWAERAVGAGSRVVRCRPLAGGITSSVHLLAFECNGEVREFVLKRWMEGDLDERRGWIDREAQILQLLEVAEVPAPRYLASTDGSEIGDVPALLMSRLPGQVWLTPTDPQSWLRQIATALARLHDVAPPEGLPAAELDHCRVGIPPDSQQPELWQRAADFLRQPAPAGTGFIHGDYQHFNLLWERERLTAVADWTWAGVGHPDRDVGHCRLNLAVLFTPQWAQDFIAAYESEAGRVTDPWWNACELARYGNDDWQQFIPIQVAGRVEVDTRGMTARVEEQLQRVTP
jgi:aminoglycoside phosphotransferase (APT) family kinase protein